MKDWSKKWVSSKSPRKQRKYVYNAPLHIAKKLISVRLNKDLKEKYGRRNVSVRKGDRVKIMVGQFKGKISKVSRVSLKHKRIYVDDAHTLKRDGGKLMYPLHPSNLMIMELELDDKLRRKSLEKK